MVPSRNLPPIPPLSIVADEGTRRVLEALVTGWESRNGLSGDQGEAFVAVADIEQGRALASPGALAGVSAGQATTSETRGSDGRIIDRRPNSTNGQARSFSPASRLFAELFAQSPSSGISQRIASIESPEWFKQRIAQYGIDEAPASADGSTATQRADAATGTTKQDTTEQLIGSFASLRSVTNPRATVELAASAGQSVVLIGETAFYRIGEHRALHYDQVEVITAVNFANQTVTKSQLWAYKGVEFNNGGVCDAALWMEDPDGALTPLRFHSMIAGHAVVAHNQVFYRVAIEKTGVHKFYLLATAERSGGYYAVAEDVAASIPPLLLAIAL